MQVKLLHISHQNLRIGDINLVGISQWLDYSTLDQRVLGSKNLQTCHIKCEERISQLSVILGKKAKGIMRRGHIDRKGQDCTAQLVFLFSGPLCFAHKQKPYKDKSVFAYQLSISLHKT